MTNPAPPPIDPETELPGWMVIRPGDSGRPWRALDPTYRDSGVAIEADDPVELVERVRSWVKVVELAAGRAAGRYAPCRMADGQIVLLPRNEAPLEAPKPATPPTLVPAPAPPTNGATGRPWTVEDTLPERPPPSVATLATEVGPPARTPDLYEIARLKGYTGNPCGTCGGMSLVRNGACEKCMDCGSTSGCS